MDQKAVIKLCKEMGCCNACCIRYIGIKNPNAYENSQQFVAKYLDPLPEDSKDAKTSEVQVKMEEDSPNTIKEELSSLGTEESVDNSMDTRVIEVDGQKPVKEEKSSIGTEESVDNSMDTRVIEADGQKPVKEEKSSIGTEESVDNSMDTRVIEAGGQKPVKKEKSSLDTEESVENSSNTRALEADSNGRISPPAKRKKTEICLSCLGILQETTWPQCFEAVKEQLDKKRYECDNFACALSAPIATLLREKAITLSLRDSLPDYDPNCLTPLKEAWKWSFGVKLEAHVGKTLTSGSSSPLLITVVMEYPDEATELEIVKVLSPSLFEARRQQKKRFAVELTRRSVEQALDDATLEAMQRLGWQPAPCVHTTAHCASVGCVHVPHYLGGRYIKLSRELPQTPWVVSGRRMMESSVQEAIFAPLAKLYQMCADEVECRMKFMSAGREDVDVRCLGEGRPFAIEISDPRRLLTSDELSRACAEISAGGKVLVKELIYVTKDDLTLLKKGEETKTKTYEALCIKLSHSKGEKDKEGPPVVTEQDISNINSYRNTDASDARIILQQKTPIRVLHRRPLLTRTRRILDLEAKLVPGSPQLFWVRLVTEAGTYVKEWVHGELGRTTPSLSAALLARTDILALDVSSVDLPWPHTKKT